MTEMRFHYKMKVIFFIPYIISKLNNDFPTIFNAICHETYRKKKVYLQHDQIKDGQHLNKHGGKRPI